VRLKNIRLKRISHPEDDIVISIFHLSRRPGGEREKLHASWERDRFDRMEMEPGISFVVMFRIDVDLMTFRGHSDTQVN
jgi:hypothetical protein